jgi:Zn-dependent protease with chaperone function
MENSGKYKLYLAGWKNPPQGSIVGDFKKIGDENFVCEIYINDDAVLKAGCIDAATTVYDGRAEISITSGMLDALQRNGVEESFELWHELGHIDCGHYETGVVDDGGAPDGERLLREEMEADSFAAGVLGGETAMTALQSMLKVRAQVDRQMKLNGTERSVAAIRGIRARIENIKNR